MEILIIVGIVGIFLFLIFDKVFLNKKGGNEELEYLKTKNIELEVQNKDLEKNNIELNLKKENLDKNNSENLSTILNLEKKISENEGKGKNLFVQNERLTSENKSLQEKNSENLKKITKSESEKTEQEKVFENKIENLENSRKSLEDEKIRIRKEDEDEEEENRQNRDRIWKEHEDVAISKMTEICQKRGFSFFGNENLPAGFTGSFKPDFLVEFLGKYIIFDAKTSKGQDLNTYIKNQFKSTAKKIIESENSEDFSKSVYLIVPNIGIKDIKTENLHSKEQGFDFYVISTESFESILACFEIIKGYKNLENLDPRERENIIEILGAYENHLTFRNSIDVLATLKGIEISSLKNKLSSEMLGKIEKHIKMENLKPNDLKKYFNKPEKQLEEIGKMISTKKASVKIEGNGGEELEVIEKEKLF